MQTHVLNSATDRSICLPKNAANMFKQQMNSPVKKLNTVTGLIENLLHWFPTRVVRRQYSSSKAVTRSCLVSSFQTTGQRWWRLLVAQLGRRKPKMVENSGVTRWARTRFTGWQVFIDVKGLNTTRTTTYLCNSFCEKTWFFRASNFFWMTTQKYYVQYMCMSTVHSYQCRHLTEQEPCWTGASRHVHIDNHFFLQSMKQKSYECIYVKIFCLLSV